MFDFLNPEQNRLLSAVIGAVLIVAAGLIIIKAVTAVSKKALAKTCLLYTSPSPRD